MTAHGGKSIGKRHIFIQLNIICLSFCGMYVINAQGHSALLVKRARDLSLPLRHLNDWQHDDSLSERRPSEAISARYDLGDEQTHEIERQFGLSLDVVHLGQPTACRQAEPAVF